MSCPPRWSRPPRDCGWPRSPKPGKLEPFKEYLGERVKSAHPSWIPATVLAREIRERGYQGCVKAVGTFVRGLKPARREDPVVRFETDPGKQMQVDWIEFKRDRLSAFVATLGHCRASYVEYVIDERIETLIACHMRLRVLRRRAARSLVRQRDISLV